MGIQIGDAPPRGTTSSFRDLRRRLAEVLAPGVRDDAGDGSTLEALRITTNEPPRLAQAALLEGTVVERRTIQGDPEVRFAAFLDGIQQSRILTYDSAVPIVHGAVSAAVRIRDDRRLTTWDFVTESRVYAPLGFLSPSAAQALGQFEIGITDITPRKDGQVDDSSRHPMALTEVAVTAVQNHRQALEQRLAESWCERAGDAVLYLDGGTSGSSRLSTAPNIVGVVKSHRVLYGDAAAIQTILQLAERERSRVFRVESPIGRRYPVASWYLRLHDPAGHNPLWGLVRVETAIPADARVKSIGETADQISRWILAERTPLSLPDGRWDTMVYGIRDCEQFLRSMH